MEKTWKTKEPITPDAIQALREYNEGFQQLLFSRGITTVEAAEEYLNAKGPMHDPFLLDGMEPAVARIAKAIQQGEKIVVYGDYDVDGVSASALLVKVLRKLNAAVESYIPDRFDEGYGLSIKALQALCQSGAQLVITVDCGIRAIAEVAEANRMGLDIIISDHHHPRNDLPEAFAVINPKKPGDPYPDKVLAGVGVAFKMAQALAHYLNSNAIHTEDYLDLVALGTVADIVPLTGENRAMVKAGIERMRTQPNMGLAALAGASRINIRNINARDIGFMLGPRLNAAGRLESAAKAFELLVTEDPEQASVISQELDDLNRKRQGLVSSLARIASEEASKETEPDIIFSVSEKYEQGVVGLVASRLVDEYYRPAIIGQDKGDEVVASCRSILEFPIIQALDEVADLFIKHGGHDLAAGFTIRRDQVDPLRQRLQKIARDKFAGTQLTPTLSADMEIDLRRIPVNIIESIERLEPTGQENPEVAFISRGVQVIYKRAVGAEGKHLQLRLKDGSKQYPAIAFNKGPLLPELKDKVDILYHMGRNEYNGVVSTQLNVIDIKLCD